MRTSKSTLTKPKATTRTRKVVAKAIETQDQEFLNSPEVQEAIRFKAYELYVQRGYVHGNDREDWAEAERIILARR